MDPKISIIIPIFNEKTHIGKALQPLLDQNPHEIIVVDGGSDSSIHPTKQNVHHPKVKFHQSTNCRGIQMNQGAKLASGDILLFHHIDSQLPKDGLFNISKLMTQKNSVGGAFDFTTDGQGWFFATMNKWVKLRTRFLKLPFGDQSIFVQKEVFNDLGGFKPIYAMEDIEFMSRLKKIGKLSFISKPVVTSSRKWKTKGRLFVTLRHLKLQFDFFVSRDNLLSQFFQMKKNLGIFLKYPENGKVKTRLATDIGPDKAVAIYKFLTKLVLDENYTANKMEAINYQSHIFFHPKEKELEIKSWLQNYQNSIYHPQKDGDLGQKLKGAFEEFFQNDSNSKNILIGSDCPEIGQIHISQAFALLDDHDLVLGPSPDGGYYLIGIKDSKHLFLLDDMPWSTPSLFSKTIKKAESKNLKVAKLEPLTDIDFLSDLKSVFDEELVNQLLS